MLTAARTPPHIGSLILYTGMSLLALNMFLPALAEMAQSFGVEYGTMNLALGGFLAVSGVAQLILGPLSDRYGRRPVLLGAFAVFAFASIIALFATNVWLFLACRLAQSVVIAGMVVSRAVLRDISTDEEAATRLAIVTMVMALAPMLGPLLGGYMSDILGWRSIFALYAGLGVLCVALIWVDQGETNTAKSASITAQFRQYPELFSSRRFWGYVVALAFAIGAFYTFISGAPLVSKDNFGLSPAMLGAGIGSISAGFMVANYVTARFTRRVGSQLLMSIGRGIALVGPVAGMIFAIAGWLDVWGYFGAVLFVGFGNGLTLPAANVGVMSVRRHLAGSAAGLSGAITVAMGAVLTSITGALLTMGPSLVLHLGLISVCSLVAWFGIAYVNRIDRLGGSSKLV